MGWTNAGGWRGSGWGKAAAAGGGVTFGLDGTATSTAVTATSVTSTTLTTANGQGDIVAMVHNNGGFTINSVTGTGLTFTRRSFVIDANGNRAEIWTAQYSSNFSGTLTASMSSSAGIQIGAIAVSGTPTSTEFDTGGPQTTNTSGSSPSITTTHASDMLYGMLPGNGVAPTIGAAGWTIFQNSWIVTMAYQQVASTGTYGFGTTTGSTGGIVDALKANP